MKNKNVQMVLFILAGIVATLLIQFVILKANTTKEKNKVPTDISGDVKTSAAIAINVDVTNGDQLPYTSTAVNDTIVKYINPLFLLV